MWKWLGAVVITSWFTYSLYNFYQITNPPHCTGPHEHCLNPLINLTDGYSLHVFLTAHEAPHKVVWNETLNIPWPSAARQPSLYAGTFQSHLGLEDDCHESSTNRLIPGSPMTSPYFDEKRKSLIKRIIPARPKCIPTLSFVMPREWRRNGTNVYITSLSTMLDQPQQTAFRLQTTLLSTLYTPEQKAIASKRFLLTQSSDAAEVMESRAGEIARAVPTTALPRRIKVGPVLFASPASVTKLYLSGRRHWVTRSKGKNRYFTPEIYHDTLVSPRDEYQSVVWTSEEEEIILKIELSNISYRKQSIYYRLLGAFDQMENHFGASKYEADSMKLLLAGESPTILLITFIVSALHMLFEYLAMSSSLSHFNETTKDASRSERVSRRAVMIDTIFEIAIVVWLHDEGEAQLIQILIGAKIIFNVWRYMKLRGMHHKTIQSQSPGSTKLSGNSFLNALSLQRLRERREAESSEEFEKRNLWSLAGLTVPAMVLFTAYQLVFVQHKSWRSWILKSCAMSSYVGGFIAMTPQLYKNFYFRSVEHLPWTTLTYQFLNTIIDDLFSFLIRMPKAQRVSVFRDDVIFVIYWIQRRHYRLSKAKVA